MLIGCDKNTVINIYNAQTDNALKKHWIPQTLETVVIAIDRSKTDVIITSWSDLRDIDESVSMSDAMPVFRLTAAAICYAFEGENFTLDPFVEIFSLLYLKEKFKFNDISAPIQICFDSDAAAKIKNGENIKIVIPAEGTLSFVRGLISDDIINLPDDFEQMLLENNLRLADGRCDDKFYPAIEQYASAVILDDYNHLNIITQDLTKITRREIQKSRLYTSADGREHILFPVIFIIITVIWVGSVTIRSQQKNIRRVIFAMALIIFSWIIIRVLKYQINDETALTRYLWYSFYIFQGFLPLCAVRIASLIGTGGENIKIPKWFLMLCAFNTLLIGFVFTNDLHGLTFKLNISEPGWSGNYGYGVFYYIVMIALLMEIICAIIIMFAKTKESPGRFVIVFPFIFIAALIIYITGYALRVPFFYEIDMSVIMCAFALLFLELCIRTGQIPVNTHYGIFFKNTGLNLRITDDNGNNIFSSDNLNNFDDNKDILLLKNKISGGYAVWQENISSVAKLKSEIESASLELEKSNKLLSNVAHAREKESQMKSRRVLYAAFEKNIAEHEQKLAEMLRFIPEKDAEFSDYSIYSDYSVYMATVAILVCYIKRKFNLLVSEINGNKSVSSNELYAYIDELTELVRPAGAQFIFNGSLTGEINTRHAILFYDFFYSVIEWAIQKKINECVVNIESNKNKSAINMSMMLSIEAMKYILPEKITKEAHVLNGLFIKEDQEDIAVLRLSLPKELEENPAVFGGGERA